MKFQFSGNLLRYVDFHREVEVDGATLVEGVKHLVQAYPDFSKIMLDANGDIRLIHRFFLNGELLEGRNFDCQVQPNDEVTVLTPIAGG